MVYLEEYIVDIGNIQKRLGIVGEDHSLYNRKESELAGNLMKRYSLIAFEGVSRLEARKAPWYEKMVEKFDYIFTYFPARLALGRNKDFQDFVLETDMPFFLNLEKYEDFYPSIHVPFLKREAVKYIIKSYLSFPLRFFQGFMYGLKHRSVPAIEMPKRDVIPIYFRDRSKLMAKSLLHELHDEGTRNILAVVGKDHFLDMLEELEKGVELRKVF